MLSLSFLSPCTYETHDQRGDWRANPRAVRCPLHCSRESFHGINESEDTFPENKLMELGSVYP
jgi:hypothetical protein